MIDYINKRLNDWARWRVSDRATLRHMLGAKSCWPDMISEAESTETVRQHGTLVPLNDLECLEMDKAVCRLPTDLRDAVTEFYTRTGTAESTAKRLGIGKATLFRHIDQAHQHILGTLNDLAVIATTANRRTLPEKIACVP